MFALLRLLIGGVALAMLLSWLSQSSGSAQLRWLNYELEATASGLMLLALACAVVGWAVIQSLRWVSNYGERRQSKRRHKQTDQGLQALNRAFLALAQGDVSTATKQQAQAQKLLPDIALPLLLGAQIATQQRDSLRQVELLQRMMDVPDTRALAARSLLAESLARNDLPQAQRYAEQAAEAAPKDATIQSLRVQLLIRQHAYTQAHELLGKWRTSRQISKAHAGTLDALLLACEAQEQLHRRDYLTAARLAEQALKLRKDWLPALLILLDASDAQHQQTLVVKLVEKHWKAVQHPHMARLHQRALATQPPQAYLKTVQSIARHAPHAAESNLWLAMAAENATQWALAKEYALASVAAAPSREAYALLANLEQHIAPHLPANALEYRALADKSGALQWHCQQCGHRMAHWASECSDCHSVDSLQWNQPLEKSIALLPAS